MNDDPRLLQQAIDRLEASLKDPGKAQRHAEFSQAIQRLRQKLEAAGSRERNREQGELESVIGDENYAEANKTPGDHVWEGVKNGLGGLLSAPVAIPKALGDIPGELARDAPRALRNMARGASFGLVDNFANIDPWFRGASGLGGTDQDIMREQESAPGSGVFGSLVNPTNLLIPSLAAGKAVAAGAGLGMLQSATAGENPVAGFTGGAAGMLPGLLPRGAKNNAARMKRNDTDFGRNVRAIEDRPIRMVGEKQGDVGVFGVKPGEHTFNSFDESLSPNVDVEAATAATLAPGEFEAPPRVQKQRTPTTIEGSKLLPDERGRRDAAAAASRSTRGRMQDERAAETKTYKPDIEKIVSQSKAWINYKDASALLERVTENLDSKTLGGEIIDAESAAQLKTVQSGLRRALGLKIDPETGAFMEPPKSGTPGRMDRAARLDQGSPERVVQQEGFEGNAPAGHRVDTTTTPGNPGKSPGFEGFEMYDPSASREVSPGYTVPSHHAYTLRSKNPVSGKRTRRADPETTSIVKGERLPGGKEIERTIELTGEPVAFGPGGEPATPDVTSRALVKNAVPPEAMEAGIALDEIANLKKVSQRFAKDKTSPAAVEMAELGRLANKILRDYSPEYAARNDKYHQTMNRIEFVGEKLFGMDDASKTSLMDNATDARGQAKLMRRGERGLVDQELNEGGTVDPKLQGDMEYIDAMRAREDLTHGAPKNIPSLIGGVGVAAARSMFPFARRTAYGGGKAAGKVRKASEVGAAAGGSTSEKVRAEEQARKRRRKSGGELPFR